MPTRRQAVAHLRLLMLLPFFMIALIPRGMMLSPTQDSLSKTLVICTSHGVKTITLNEAMGLPSIPDLGEQDPQENSCPYSVANSAYIDTSHIIAILEAAVITPSLLAHYRVQYLLKLYPAGFPRGPPAIV